MIGSIRFVLRVDKIRKTGVYKGMCPIEGIYSLSGQRKRFYPEIYLFEGNWDAVTQTAKPIKESQAKQLFDKGQLPYIPTTIKEAESINNILSGVKASIEKVENSFEGGIISSNIIIDKFKESQVSTTVVKDESKTFVYEFIDKYIQENEPSRAKGSLTVYKSLKSHLQAFQKSKKIAVRFEDMNNGFFEAFQNFLITRVTPRGKTLNNITIAKQLSTLKTFLGYARKNGIAVSDGYKDFKIRKQKLEVIALTENEFYRLLNLDLSSNKRLDQVRDVFCFSCMVGFRYSDVAQLKRIHIKGSRIQLTVKKTKENITVPLNAIAFNILEKYKDMAKPLPVISNQKYNDYIKELCKIAEIDEPIEIVRFRGASKVVNVYPKYEVISAHSARKTFASMLLAKGISAQVIMDLGGWSDFKSFQRYIKVNEKTKENAVYSAFGEPQHLKAVGGAE